MRRPDTGDAGSLCHGASVTLRRRGALAALLAVGPAAWLASDAGTAAAQGADGVTVGGDVRQPYAAGPADLRAFEARAQRELRERRDAGTVQRDTTVRGVALTDLLLRAGLAERDRLDWRKTVVVAIARDGYRAVFSWPELFNTEGGAQVMVAYERDGGPLPAGDGPLALMAPGDQRTGPRHVKGLVRVDVRILRD